MKTPFNQFGLFDREAPFVRGSDTSEAAAKSIEPDAKTLRGIILAFIRGRGDFGATCDEVEREFKLRHQTASARINELMNGGYIVDAGKRRRTSSGRKAICWEAVPELRGMLRRMMDAESSPGI